MANGENSKNNKSEYDDDDTDEKEVQLLPEAQTWPADCYSFVALHGLIENPGLFLVGFSVWAFQVRYDT